MRIGRFETLLFFEVELKRSKKFDHVYFCICSVSSDEMNVPMARLVRATLDVHERRRIQPNRIFEEAKPEHLIKILSNRERSQSSDEWLSSGTLHSGLKQNSFENVVPFLLDNFAVSLTGIDGLFLQLQPVGSIIKFVSTET